MLTGDPVAKLAAAAVMDQKAKAQTAPPAPTQSVIDKLAQPQGLAQLPQGMAPQGPAVAPQQLAQAEAPAAQMADGGIVGLPIDSGMFEGGYAGGGIIAFDDGGDVPGYASQGAVKRPAYLSNPVGKYFNPADLAKYDDAEIQQMLKENPYLTQDQIYEQQEKARTRYGIKNLFEEQNKALEADKAENEKFKESIEADALLNAAAGFLGNTSPFFGPGAEAGLKGYTTTKREGQKEYRANAKDIRNLGFEIGRSDQAMRQAVMSGDQALYNSERARHEGLLKEAREVKYKNTETTNKLLGEGAQAAATRDMNVEVAGIRESGDNARARAKARTDLFNKAADNAITQMSKLYPLGAQDPKFDNLAAAGTYANATEAYNAELKTYTDNNLVSMAAEAGINPKEILSAKPTDAEAPAENSATMATPAQSTVTGKLVTIPDGKMKGKYELLPNGKYKRVG
jgi:putative heme iron utilization protein